MGVVCGFFVLLDNGGAGTGEDVWLLLSFLLSFSWPGVCVAERKRERETERRDVMQACWYMLIRKPRVDASRVRVPGEDNDWLPDAPLSMAGGGVVNIQAQGQLTT